MERINDYMDRARLLAQALAESLPTHIDAAALPLDSKLPFLVFSLRELLIHRASALASPAVDLYESGNEVSAIVLTRSLMETTAIVFELYRKLDSFVATKDEESLGKYLMKSLFANRYPDGGEMAKYYTKSILTPIQKLDEHISGFASSYDALSEYAHPNWSGVMGSFGTIDQKRHIIDFGRRATGKTHEIGAKTLATTLDILLTYYDEMSESLLALNQHFEPGWCEGQG